MMNGLDIILSQAFLGGSGGGNGGSEGMTLTEFIEYRGCNYLYYNCSYSTSLPELDTSNITSMSNMFYGCSKLESVPKMNTSNVTNMNMMFNGCKALTTVPKMDTRNVKNMGAMFNNCAALQTVEELDMRSVSGTNSTSNMFYGCKALTNLTLKNIAIVLTVGSGTTYGHLLTVDSLVKLIYELRTVTSSKKLTIGTANLEKLANVYVKTIEITDAMRAEDDLIDEKLPFVVCESTDEGATLITDYVVSKNWTLG